MRHAKGDGREGQSATLTCPRPAQTLGVSVMTLHRWRKGYAGAGASDERFQAEAIKPRRLELLSFSSKIRGCGDW
jgi:hypothetical protein